jgi:anti-repressor protein
VSEAAQQWTGRPDDRYANLAHPVAHDWRLGDRYTTCSSESIMSNLIPFDFNSNSIRVITLDNGYILFVASDVAKCLGYGEPHKAVSAHCKKAKSLNSLDGTNHPVQKNQRLDAKTKLIPESDVYRLVMRSKLESAEAFQDWIVEEVIPSIRKTGKYEKQSTNIALPDFTDPAEAAEAWAQQFRLAKQERQRANVLEQKVEEDRPKVEFALAVRHLDGSCLVEEFAKAIGIGRNRFFKRLRDDGYLMINNLPYQKYIDAGWFVVIENTPFTDSNGKSHPTFTTRITGKGQVALEKRYRSASRCGLVLAGGAA